MPRTDFRSIDTPFPLWYIDGRFMTGKGKCIVGSIIVGMDVREEHRQWILEAAGETPVVFDPSPSDALLSEAEIVVGNLPLARLEGAKSLKLLQLNSAGAGGYGALCRRQPPVTVCTASGAYGTAIAEHMLGMLLALQKKLFLYRDLQREGAWKDLGPVTGIIGSRVLVLGMGNIGSEFGRRCAALGAAVTGVRRSRTACPDWCESVAVYDALDALLPDADVVFMSMPETLETVNMMNAERIARMKPGAILLNAGRGSAVDTTALTEALTSGRLGGAGLDVTAPEPLPPEHPLWQCPNAMITPHVSGGYHLSLTHDNIIRIACGNLKAWLSGAALRNVLDPEKGY